MARLSIASDEVELARRAAARLTELIEQAAAQGEGRALVALTGGTTPRRLYSTLADAREPWRARIPWSQMDLFWGDERHVPPDHPDSNYGMASSTLLRHVPIAADRVHRMHGEMPDAGDAAADYARVLAEVASSAGRTSAGDPRGRSFLFDVMLLGVGDDAHIASIFPGSELLEAEDGRLAAAVWAAHLGAWRLTLTPRAILDSRTILVLVSGSRKADAVHAALDAPLDVNRYPAQLLRRAGDRVEWFLDRGAAPLDGYP